MKAPSSERLLAIDILTGFFAGDKNDKFVSNKDARINQVYNIVYGVLRKHYHFNEYINLKIKKAPPLKVLLIIQLAMFELLCNRSSKDYAAISEALNLADFYNFSTYKGLINAVLRNLDLKLVNTMPIYPVWIIEEIEKAFHEDSDSIIKGFQNISPLFITVNNLKISDKDFLSKMNEKDIFIKELQPFGFSCESRRILETSEFSEGLFLIQDLAAQHSVEMLKPYKGMRMLDLCSAPGGKSIKAAIMSEGDADIIAVDKSSLRLQKFYENIKKTGINCIKIVNSNPLKNNFGENSFDRVIVDPPCTALGVIGRHPDILINRKKEDVLKLAELQYQLLCKGFYCLKSGGRLVYSVCTFTEAETIGVINKAMQNLSGIIKADDFLMTLPNDLGMDGHFIAVIEKE